MARILNVSVPEAKANLLTSLEARSKESDRSKSDLVVEALEQYLKVSVKVPEAQVCQFCGEKASKLYTRLDDSKVLVCWLHERKVPKATVKAWKAL